MYVVRIRQISAEKYLEIGADFIIQGEGELTLQELLQNIHTDSFDPSSVLGIVYQDKELVVKNPKRPVLRDLG